MSALSGILLLVRRSLRQHAMSTSVTLLAVALASGLVMAVFSIQEQSRAAFTGGPAGFDAVLGARGSQLQLVLNTVFHLETSPGNIPWSQYKQIADDPRVSLAIPYATGDSYHGFRIVGTTEQVFTDFEYLEGKKFAFRAGGRAFDPGYMEAVIGSYVAQKTGLKVGDEFHPAHGLAEQSTEEHEEEYTVTGITETTNTPSDRVIWIPIEGIFRMGGHVLRANGEAYVAQPGEEIPEENREVSAVMLKLKNARAGFDLDMTINKQGKDATLAYPIGRVMAELFDKIGWVNRVFELVTYLVVVVSAAAILAGLYNTINERRREFAILRALGARQRTVFAAIVIESSVIAALGSALGYGVYAAILAGAAIAVRAETGVQLDAFAGHVSLVATPVAMIALGALAGIVPAIKAYRTDVAEHLAPHS